jgi:hypothetical protein
MRALLRRATNRRRPGNAKLQTLRGQPKVGCLLDNGYEIAFADSDLSGGDRSSVW